MMSDIVQQLRQGSLTSDDYRWKAADEIERLREWNAEIALNARAFVVENERLRATLGVIAGCEPYMIGEWAIILASAALAEGVTSPDERKDSPAADGGLTENHCDREDCKGRIEQLEADLAEARFDLSMLLKVGSQKDELIDNLRARIKAQGRVISFLDSKNDSLEQKTQYWPDNAERDAVIRHQKEVIERLREALLSLGAQAGDIRAMLEPRG